MKLNILRKCLLLLVMIMGVAQVEAQSVSFTHHRYRGYQVNSENTWRYFSSLNLTTSSDWIQSGNSWASNGNLGSNYSTFIQRYNVGTWSGDLFDWFYLTFTAPSYSYVTFNVDTKIYAYHSKQNSSIRVAYFDYGTDTYNRWGSYGYDPNGYSDFRTSCGLFENKITYSNVTSQGEKIAAWVYRDGYYSNNKSTSSSVTIDNRTGSSNSTTYRYGGFSSSKSKGGGYEHRTELQLKQSYSISYYKYITYNANGGTGSMSSQTQSSAFNLSKNAFTRTGYTFDGWATSTTGTKAYDDQAYFAAITSSTRGRLDLYARWKPNNYTITLQKQNADGTYTNGGTVQATYDAAYPALDNSTYGDDGRENKYFAGYYTQPNGMGTRVYDHNLQPLVAKYTTAGSTTLYAHYSHSHHDMYWDYTYKNGDSYSNIAQDDASNRVKYARLTFYNESGVAMKSVVMTASDATNKSGMTDDILNTHTLAHADIHLYVGTESDVLVGKDVKVYFTEAQLAAFRSYKFEALSSTTQVAANWTAETNKELHATILSYSPVNNNYDQMWTVTIVGLKINPDCIFVKPLFKNANSQWEEISQLVNSTGVKCNKGSEGTLSNGLPYATYSGSYPVWKSDANGINYEYAIGLVGFTLGGQTYYMNTANPGAWEQNFTSTFSINQADVMKNTADNADRAITYTVSAATIPVVRFLPHEDGDENGAELTPTTPAILVTGHGDVITDFATKYQATRHGYNFAGWYEIQDNDTRVDVPTEGNDLRLERAHTVYPKWTGATCTITINGESVTATYGSVLPNLQTIPALTGYTFGGYFTEEEGQGTQYYNADGTGAKEWDMLEDVILYPYWIPNEYTITLVNGNNLTNGSATATYGKVLPDVEVPSVSGKLFKGYYTAATDGELVYDHNGSSQKVWEATDGATYYAQWQEQSSQEITALEDPDNAGDFYTTFYIENANYCVPAGVEIYTAAIEDIDESYPVAEGRTTSIISVKRAWTNVIPRNEGVILKSNHNNYTITETLDNYSFNNNDLRGTVRSDETAPDDCFILSYGYNFLGFYPANGRTLTPNKAYLLVENASAKSLRFVFDDDNTTTAIENVSAEDHGVDSTVIYRLDGTRVNKLQKGINIVGGKKYIMK